MQTVYRDSPVRPVPGLMRDTGNPSEIITRIATDASVRPGVFVSKPTSGTYAKDQAALPTVLATQITNIANLWGVVRGDVAVEGQPAGSALRLFNQYDALAVVRKGAIWVEAETGLVVGGPVFVRYAAGAGGAVLGAIRNDADTTTAGALAATQVSVLEISTELGSTGAPMALISLVLP